MCQTIQLVEKETEATTEMAAAYPQAAQNELEALDGISRTTADRMVALCEKLLKR
jgi:enoyl reductase-like protein